MKKITFLFAMMCVLSLLPLQAQSLGGSLKKSAKGFGDAAKSAAAETAESAKKTANETLNDAKDSATETATSAAGSAQDATFNQIGAKEEKWLDENNTVLSEGSEYVERLNALVSGYTTVDGLALNYKVYRNDEANILACANGAIRIYTGMMDLLEDDELLAVIAIQIGHIQNKDLRANIQKVATKDNVNTALVAQLNKLLSLSGQGLGTFVNELIQVPYTASQNTAADDYAYELLKKNGSSTEGLANVLAAFAVAEEENADATARYISVNSGNKERAEAIAAK